MHQLYLGLLSGVAVSFPPSLSASHSEEPSLGNLRLEKSLDPTVVSGLGPRPGKHVVTVSIKFVRLGPNIQDSKCRVSHLSIIPGQLLGSALIS